MQGTLRRVLTNCPKCGFRLSPGVGVHDDCPACGIVMSKWQDATGAPTPSARPRPPAPKEGKSSNNTNNTLLLLLLLVSCLWLWEQLPSPLPEGVMPPPVAVDGQLVAPAAAPEGSTATEAPSRARESEVQSSPRSAEGQSGQDTATTSAATAEGPDAGPGEDSPGDLEDSIPTGGHSPIDWRPSRPSSDYPMDLGDWYSGKDGYIQALRRKSRVERPMVVYFRTDWCPWSRRFEDEFLSVRGVNNAIADMIRVQVDPDGGPDEARLTDRFGVTGYPAFYVIPAGAGKPVLIAPFPEGEPLSTAAFIARVRRAAAQ